MANTNSSYRVKRLKHRPIDSRERLPAEADSCDGKVFVYFGGKIPWESVTLSVVLIWASKYTLYWAPARKLS